MSEPEPDPPRWEWGGSWLNVPLPSLELWWWDETTAGLTLGLCDRAHGEHVAFVSVRFPAPPWLRRVGDWQHRRTIARWRARGVDDFTPPRYVNVPDP